MTNTASIGHNNPPTLLDDFNESSNKLLELSRGTLCGEEISSQDQAEQIKLLAKEIHELIKKGDTSRKADKKPHKDAADKVDADYKINLDALKLAKASCKNSLTPWNIKIQQERDRIAAEKRVEADRLERETKEQRDKSTESNDLEEVLKRAQENEESLKEAEILKAAANKISKAPTGLRTNYEVEAIQYRTFIAWLIQHRKEDFEEMLMAYASKHKHSLRHLNGTGVTYKEIKGAV